MLKFEEKIEVTLRNRKKKTGVNLNKAGNKNSQKNYLRLKENEIIKKETWRIMENKDNKNTFNGRKMAAQL